MKLSDIGPGLLLAATGIGVGDMVSSTIAGAEYGLTLVWALAAGVIIKFAITEGAARWQLGHRQHAHRGLARSPAARRRPRLSSSTSSSGATSSRARWSRRARWCRPRSFPSVPLPVWGLIHAVAAFVMVWFGRYERFLAVIKWFVGLKFGAIIASVLLIVLWSGADWSRAGAQSPFSTAYTLSLIGGVGGTVTLLSYGYWMREAGWSGRERMQSARGDLHAVVLPRVHLLLLDDLPRRRRSTGQGRSSTRVRGCVCCSPIASAQEIGPIGRGGVPARLLGRGVLVGARRVSRRAVSLRRHGCTCGAGSRPADSRASPIARGPAYLRSRRSRRSHSRPVWLVFAYTVVGSLFFPFVISTLLWLNNSRMRTAPRATASLVNGVLSAALLLYVLSCLRSVLSRLA